MIELIYCEQNASVAPIGPRRREYLPAARIRGDVPPSVNELIRAGVRTVYANSWDGWHGGELGFVADVPGLLALDLVLPPQEDWSFLGGRSSWKSLSLQFAIEARHDFADMCSLESLFCYWSPGLDTALSCPGLEWLSLSRFRQELSVSGGAPPDLKSLSLAQSKLSGVSWLMSSKSLRRLDIVQCRGIASLSPLGGLSALEWLYLDGLKGVAGLEELAALERLEYLCLSNCGELLDISFISGLASLRAIALVGDTRVVGGDLSPIIELPSLRLANIPHHRGYSHRVMTPWKWSEIERAGPVEWKKS